jgi:hypothetical protein
MTLYKVPPVSLSLSPAYFSHSFYHYLVSCDTLVVSLLTVCFPHWDVLSKRAELCLAHQCLEYCLELSPHWLDSCMNE